jgi:ArsR family transcriptional regulator
MPLSIRLFAKANISQQASAVQNTLRREVHQLHAGICQALSDPNRILILYELREGPRNVGELAETLDMSQPTVSRHLKVLRERGMVLAARERTSIYYTLKDPRVIEALNLLREVLAAILEQRTALAEELA